MRRKWKGRILSFLLTFVMLFQIVPMSVSAANHNDTNFLNFAYDANGIIAGYVSEIDGKSDFTVEDGCVVLKGGVSNKTIRIKIQMDANYYYTYCICRPGYTMDQYNRYGVEFDGDSDKWTASYDKYNGFAYNGSTEITLNYNDYKGSPLYGKRIAKIWISRLEENGYVANSYNQYYSLPLVFVVDADSVSASASISWENRSTNWEYPIDSGDGKALKANWNLAGNTGISASYQWYKKVGDTYTKIDGATGQTYVPTEIGTYKVDVALTVTSITAGVPKGSTYTASAEKTIIKANPAVQVGWERSGGNFSQNKTVTLNDAVSMQLYSKAAGKIAIKKNGSTVKTEDISTGYSTLDLGEATLDMGGAYSWEFTPNNTAFCNAVSGSGMNLTVNKLASGTSASMSTYISTADYQGSISMKANVPGTFTFETEGRLQDVVYTTAGTSYTWTDLSLLIPKGTAAGNYTMNYKFVPLNAADYKEENGSMSYTVDEAMCNIVIQQKDGGTVKVNDKTSDFRGSVGETYAITVKPVAGSASTNSSVKSVTVNGQDLEESALTRNSDGSVTASYTIPKDGTNQTYTISAEYNYQKLVLKNNAKYYHDTIDILNMGVGLSLGEAEKAILDTVLDTGSSRGISYDGTVDIVYYQGIQKEIMTGEETECWDKVNAYVLGGGFLGDYRHTFGTETTEKIRVSIKGTSMSAETTIRIIKRTATSVNAQNAVAVSYDSDGAVMQNAMINALGASVSEYVDNSLQEIAGAELSYTDTAGNAIDWSKVQGGDTISVKISYAGTKTDNGGYGSSNKTVSVYVRPEASVDAATKTYTGSELFWETADFTPADTAVTVNVDGVEGYYDSSKTPITAPIHAGSYYVKLNLSDTYGSYTSGYVPIKVEPAEFTIYNLTAEDRIYDGTATVKITGAELSGIIGNDDVQVDLSNSSASVSSKNVGTYNKVKADGITYTGTSAGDYKVAEAVKKEETALTAPVTISEKEVTITGASVASSKEYDGNTVAVITDAGIVSGKVAESDVVTVLKGTAVYENKNVGKDKSVTFSGFTLTGADAGNYKLIRQPAEVKAEIRAKELEITAEVEDRQYNGQMRTTQIVSASPSNLVGEDEVTLDTSGASAVFTGIGNADTPTTVKVSISGIRTQGADAGNYSLSQPFEVDGTIVTDYAAEKDTDYCVNSNDWINTEFVVAGTDGYLISETAAADGEWKTILKSNTTDSDGKGSLSFYVKAPNGDISKKATEDYKIDTTAPTGTLEIGENSWKSFLNKATLGLFFNNTHEVKVTAEDQENLSGVKSIEYFEYTVPAGGEGLSLDENGQLPVAESVWKTYQHSISVNWEEETAYVYYVRITDHAGNVTYLCSHEGIEYDVTNPVIYGVENQKSYYTTQKISAEDRNFDQATVNESQVSLPYALEGNKDMVYTVTAKDKAGNSVTYTITMKSISSLEDLLEGITKDNVISEDRELINEVSSIIKAEDTDDATNDEKDALDEILKKCDELNERLDEVQEKLDKGTGFTTPVTEDNLEKDDKEDLEKGQEILDELLNDYKDNFTQEEIDQIENELKRVEDLLDHIKDSEDVLDSIEKLPDSIQTDDEDGKTEDAILDAKDAYEALDDIEKSMVDKECLKKLEDLLKTLTDYHIIEGAEQEWRRKSDDILVFRANGPLRKFVSAEIDGMIVDKSDYEVSAGSTIVTLPERYLLTLSVGEHTFRMNYTDGSTELVKFRIQEAHSTGNVGNNGTDASGDTNAPVTGDTANTGLWMAVLVSGAVVLLLMKKKIKFLVSLGK